jgi:hypothetical protein
MAMTHEHIESWAMDALLETIAERIRVEAPTLVFDRRVARGENVNEHLSTDDFDFNTGSTIDLADASSWSALIVPDSKDPQIDLRCFARSLAIWCAGTSATIAAGIPKFTNDAGASRLTELIKSWYDSGPSAQVIGDTEMSYWRSTLRDLGEGPRVVVDDPWFSHLFLSPTAAEFRLARPYTRIDLRSTRVPRRTAQRIARVVFDRFVGQLVKEHTTNSDPICFILEGRDLEPVPSAETTCGTDMPQQDIRLIWVDRIDDTGGARPTDRASVDGSPESDDDDRLYWMFSNRMDRRHRPAYVKGMMYGYGAFCRLEKPNELSEDLFFLREAGMALGMTSPLVELFNDSEN